MTVAVGSLDWDHDHWAGSFYPDDLPPEWRLSYYANQFRAVLVPADRLLGTAPETVAAWAEDVPEDFGFWVELEPQRLDGALPRLRALGGRLAGTVAGPGVPPDWAARVGAAVGRAVTCAVAGGGSPVAGACLACAGDAPPEHPCCVWRLAGLPGTTRSLGDRLRAFVAAGGAVEDGLVCFPPLAGTPEAMEQAQVVLDLLGA